MTTPRNSRARSGRVYVWPPDPPHELEVVNVTGVISGGLPKPFLKGWAAREVASAAVNRQGSWRGILEDEGPEAAVKYLSGAPYRHTRARADVGTEVHDLIDRRIKGWSLPDNVGDEARRYLAGYDRFVDDWQPEYLHTEVTAYSRTHGYAGTMDALATFGARPDLGVVVTDWKTSKATYPDYAIQAAALANADFLGLEAEDGTPTEEPMPEVRHGLIVRLTPHGEYEAKLARVDAPIFETFLACKRVAAWRDLEATALSEPVLVEGATPALTSLESKAVRVVCEHLRDHGAATVAELAEALDLSERAVKGRLKRAASEHGMVTYVKGDDGTWTFSFSG